MRIIHIMDYFHPVLGYQETFLAREQAKMGHDVYVVTSNCQSRPYYTVNKELLGNRIVNCGFFIEQGIKVWRLKKLFELPSTVWMLGLERKVRELKPDIVYVHSIVGITQLRIAMLKRKYRNFKLVYDDHMTSDNSTSRLRRIYPLFRLTLSRLIQQNADALVAIIPETRTFMHEKYGIPLERITIIPLGADGTAFRFDNSARRETRRELSLNDNDIVFIFPGRIVPEKKLRLLIDAMELLGNYDNLKVLLVGNGPEAYIEELKHHISIKSLGSRFIWHDTVPNKELYRYFSAADVAVWPYGAGISMREAMACSLPIIISKDSKTTELVDYENGLILQEANALELARKMEKLLDPILRREMGLRGRRLIEEKFNWRIIAQRFIELCSP